MVTMIQSMAVICARAWRVSGLIDRQYQMRRPQAVQINGVLDDYHSCRGGSGFSCPGINVEPWKIAAVHYGADAMTAPEQVAGSPQVDGQLIDLARSEQRSISPRTVAK